ncbi:MAG: dipeptide/oligopeptide/nickel ABC transporter ATP-binding protein [Eubacteriales bacterium]|nr:dipeptide/oligopeptide/nickel ABC transporter ATP-binding protein [Eubacteriales bacterium]
MSILEVEQLKKSYGKKENQKNVLEDVSFYLKEGETIGIWGISGSGKSTIGKILTGLEKKDSGRIIYQEKELRYPLRNQNRKDIQILFQHPEVSFNPKYKIEQGFHEVYRKCKLNFSRVQLLLYLEKFGLYQEHIERKPAQLSGGELQRAMIARVMLLSPKILVLDEPTSMLDPISQAQILRMLERIQKKTGVAYIYITHNKYLAKEMCKRIYHLEHGHLQEISC